MKNLTVYAFILVGLLSCQQDSNKITTSKNEISTWAFRSVMDGIPRMLTIQLTDDLFASYNTQNASLVKIWKGIVNLEGAVYDGAHGPQPTSMGDAYIKNATEYNPWSIKGQPAGVEYKGHRLEDNATVILSELKGSNQTYNVEEKIELIGTDSETPSIKRTVTVDKPSNDLTWVQVYNVVDKSQIKVSSKFDSNLDKTIDFKNKKFESHNVSIPLIENEITVECPLIDPIILDPNLDDGFTKDINSLPIGAQLIGKHDCRSCHNSQKKTIGPAYVSIAKKYAHNDENNLMLVNKIKNGGSGIWGEQVMTPHPEIEDYDLKEMVNYIFTLAPYENEGKENEKIQIKTYTARTIEEGQLVPGSMTRVYNIPKNVQKMPSGLLGQKPIMAGILPNFDNLSGDDFKDLEADFAIISTGFFHAQEAGKYQFRMWSDDGSKLYLHNELVVDHDGLHGTSMKQTEVELEEGYHPFKIEFFQGQGGKFLSWNYKKSGDDIWKVVPSSMIEHDRAEQIEIGDLNLPMSVITQIPGDKSSLTEVHPSFDLSSARPQDFNPKVGGMDFLSDGRLVVSVWDEEGAIYLLDNTESTDQSKITYKKIAQGLAEPLGIAVKDDRIFVMQKQEITELIDNNGDDIIDEYKTLCDDWGVTNNFHEFGFGLAEKDGYLYAALATGIMPGGAGMKNQHPDRGSCIKVSIEDGSIEFVANGLRTPNGVGVGYGGDIFIADNQGDWLPSSKIVHVQNGDWFGSRAVDFEGTAKFKEKKPVVWLPQDEIGNSPTTPLALNIGPYKNQMIHGEVTHGGVKRVFVEEVNGQLQGCVFRFIQGLEAGVNRIAWAPDGKTLYAGGIGNPGNWQHSGKSWYGLEKMTYNGKSTFEMLSISARTDGIVIEFTEPLKNGEGWSKGDYEIQQWYYKPTADYGGPKLDQRNLNIQSVNISKDRKKVFLRLDGMKDDHVIYVRLLNHFVSENEHSLWSTEGWYTMNYIPKNKKGMEGFDAASPVTLQDNTLTEKEKSEGWELLFDGKSIDKFHTFKKDKVDSKWVVEDGTIAFNPKLDGDGGDLVTNNIYEDFEFSLEWKISNCGNSGIMFNVVEEEKFCCTWQTGPEMQILDNSCHPDTKFVTHRAGDLYDMIETKYVTVKPAGQWNKIRIVSNEGAVDFWMNGHKVVKFEIGTDKWQEMIANSKFKDMADFGQYSSGHISLQDHADKVWFKNIKIRKL